MQPGVSLCELFKSMFTKNKEKGYKKADFRPLTFSEVHLGKKEKPKSIKVLHRYLHNLAVHHAKH